MSRRSKIFAILITVAFIFFVVAYFVPPIKSVVDQTLGPPLSKFFGGFTSMVTSSPIWKNWIVPWPNQAILGAILIGFPIAWLWHRSYNSVRARFVRSADREAGRRPLQVEPVSQPSYPQPTPTAQPVKQETAPPPPPPAQPKATEAEQEA